MQMSIVMKDTKANGSFIEFARLKDKFLYDEVHVTEFRLAGTGVDVHFTYVRNGQTFPVDPVSVTALDFSVARAAAAGDKSKFAETKLVQRLFAEGARRYIASKQKAEEDFVADMEFISSLND